MERRRRRVSPHPLVKRQKERSAVCRMNLSIQHSAVTGHQHVTQQTSGLVLYVPGTHKDIGRRHCQSVGDRSTNNTTISRQTNRSTNGYDFITCFHQIHESSFMATGRRDLQLSPWFGHGFSLYTHFSVGTWHLEGVWAQT